jgi:hypothetical protein
MGEFMEAALARTRDEVPEPKDLPNGTWRFKAVNAKPLPAKSEDGNASIQIVYVPLAAMDDVDPADLEGFELETARVFHRQWMGDARDEWAFWEYAAKHGIKTSGRTMADIIPEFKKGYEVIAQSEQKIGEDGERVLINLSNFSKA